MRVRQYVYFGIRSATLTPDVISQRAGLPADDAQVKGSRHAGPPPVPRSHLWKVRSGLSDRTPLDEQLMALVSKIAPHEANLAALLTSTDALGALQFVRVFEDGAEDADIVESGSAGADWVRLGGQHPLVGFHLDAQVIGLVQRLGIEIDFDEYGDE